MIDLQEKQHAEDQDGDSRSGRENEAIPESNCLGQISNNRTSREPNWAVLNAVKMTLDISITHRRSMYLRSKGSKQR